MTTLTVPWNGNPDLISSLAQINADRDAGDLVITDMRGSTEKYSRYASRQDGAPDIDSSKLMDQVERAENVGIRLIYALDNPYFGFFDHKPFATHLSMLWDSGIRHVEIANLALAKALLLIAPGFKVSISPLAKINQLSMLRTLPANVESVCIDPQRNRDIWFLMSANPILEERGIDFQLVVNDFCSSSVKNSVSECIHKITCFSGDLVPGPCTWNRKENVTNWLKIPVIRPDDVERYERVGVNSFRMLEPTGGTDDIVRMALLYASKEHRGNFFDLYNPNGVMPSISTPTRGRQKKLYLENESVDKFLNHWFNQPHFRCAEQDCGVAESEGGCTFCDRFLTPTKPRRSLT